MIYFSTAIRGAGLWRRHGHDGHIGYPLCCTSIVQLTLPRLSDRPCVCKDLRSCMIELHLTQETGTTSLDIKSEDRLWRESADYLNTRSSFVTSAFPSSWKTGTWKAENSTKWLGTWKGQPQLSPKNSSILAHGVGGPIEERFEGVHERNTASTHVSLGGRLHAMHVAAAGPTVLVDGPTS